MSVHFFSRFGRSKTLHRHGRRNHALAAFAFVTATIAIGVGCVAPREPRDAPVDVSPTEFGVRVVVDAALRESIAYPVGMSPNRHLPANRFQVELAQAGPAVVIACTSLGNFSRSVARITLDPTSHTARAEVSWETDAVKERHWSNVYGLILIDHWPAGAADPVRMRYLLCGFDRTEAHCWSEAIDTSPRASDDAAGLHPDPK